MVKKIAIITATRAEYGLLEPVVKQLRMYEDNLFRVELIVTGTHLSSQYGNTLREIEDAEVRIDEKIAISIESQSELDISRNQADVLVKFSELFLRKKYDAVLLLGDRYETLAIAIAAGNTKTPVFHLCGGDTTEGAIDEWIRHSITKISYLHFTTNEESKKRVIQLGESPERVFNYGSTSIDNIKNMKLMSKREALEAIGLQDCRFAICTYHPVTMESTGVEGQMQQFFEAIRAFPEFEFIVTKTNADQGGARINELLDQTETQINNMHVFSSLGMKRYLSLMCHADFVLGNSSSGIIEAPALKVPTVNIGDRQKGRLQSPGTVNCGPDTNSILMAIRTALSNENRDKCRRSNSLYGDGHAAERIARKTVEVVLAGNINLKKSFWNGNG